MDREGVTLQIVSKCSWVGSRTHTRRFCTAATVTGASMDGSSKPVVLWRESEWRCEYQCGFGGRSRLEVYHHDQLATSEDTPSGEAARIRAEVLRRRALRGNIPSG